MEFETIQKAAINGDALNIGAAVEERMAWHGLRGIALNFKAGHISQYEATQQKLEVRSCMERLRDIREHEGAAVREQAMRNFAADAAVTSIVKDYKAGADAESLLRRAMAVISQLQGQQSNPYDGMFYSVKDTSSDSQTRHLPLKGKEKESGGADVKKTKDKPVKHKHGEFGHVLLTDEEYSKLEAKFGAALPEKIRELDEGIEIKRYKYANHYLVILRWDKKDREERAEKNSSGSGKSSYDISAFERDAAKVPEYKRKGA